MFLKQLMVVISMLLSVCSAQAQPGDAPDALIKRLSTEVLERVKNDKAIQSGDIPRIIEVVDTQVMPHVNFQRMTASVVGRPWRAATPEQRQRLQNEFKTLLVRTYAGALTQFKDQTVSFKPMRAAAGDTEVVVRTEVKSPGSQGEPLRIDYRLEKTDSGWKIYDINVIGIWLVDQYKSNFAQEIGEKGIDGLIAKLSERNKAAARS